MKRWYLPLFLVTFVSFASFAQEATKNVWLVDLNGPVGPASVDLIIRTIEDAQAGPGQPEAVIIRMNTPGGLDKAMRDLVQVILSSDVPVVTYVAPDGARAASAGTYIAYASHVAAMSPASNIGSSTPVSLAPTPQMPTPKDGNEEKPTELDAMSRKVVNDAVAYLQSLAELRNRNVEWAEETVREGANLRASEALDQNVIDLVAANVDDLLKQMDGIEVSTPAGSRTIQTADAHITFIETDWRHELLQTITDPSIAYGMLIIGIYALMLEFYNPGLIIPAVTGLILILLATYGLQMLPVNYVGVALLLVGMGLMVAEVVTPTFGVLGIGGLIAFVLGSIVMFDSDLPGYDLPIGIIAAFTAATGLTLFFIVGAAVRARNAKVVTGMEALLGSTGEAVDDFETDKSGFRGYVFVAGENWIAECSDPVSAGDTLQVENIDGLTLSVSKED